MKKLKILIALLVLFSAVLKAQTWRGDSVIIYDDHEIAIKIKSSGIDFTGKSEFKGFKCINPACDSMYLYFDDDSIKLYKNITSSGVEYDPVFSSHLASSITAEDTARWALSGGGVTAEQVGDTADVVRTEIQTALENFRDTTKTTGGVARILLSNALGGNTVDDDFYYSSNRLYLDGTIRSIGTYGYLGLSSLDYWRWGSTYFEENSLEGIWLRYGAPATSYPTLGFRTDKTTGIGSRDIGEVNVFSGGSIITTTDETGFYIGNGATSYVLYLNGSEFTGSGSGSGSYFDGDLLDQTWTNDTIVFNDSVKQIFYEASGYIQTDTMKFYPPINNRGQGAAFSLYVQSNTMPWIFYGDIWSFGDGDVRNDYANDSAWYLINGFYTGVNWFMNVIYDLPLTAPIELDTIAPIFSNTSVSNIGTTTAQYNAQLNESGYIIWGVYPNGSTPTKLNLRSQTGIIGDSTITSGGVIENISLTSLPLDSALEVHSFARDDSLNETDLQTAIDFNTLADTDPPVLQSAFVNDDDKNRILLLYDEQVLAASVAAFSVSGGKTISFTGQSGDTVFVGVSSDYAFGDVITISYTSQGVADRIEDVYHNPAANLTNQSVNNNIVGVIAINAPVLDSAVAQSSDSIVVYFTDNNTSPNEDSTLFQYDTENTFSTPDTIYAAQDADSLIIPGLTASTDIYIRGMSLITDLTYGNSAYSNTVNYTTELDGLPFPPTVWGIFNGTTSTLQVPVALRDDQDWTLEFDIYTNTANHVNFDMIYTDRSSTSEGVSLYFSLPGVDIAIAPYPGTAINSDPASDNTWERWKFTKVGSLFSIYKNDVFQRSETKTFNQTLKSAPYHWMSFDNSSLFVEGNLANIKLSGNGAGNNYEIIDPSTGVDTSGDGNNGTPINVTQGN